MTGSGRSGRSGLAILSKMQTSAVTELRERRVLYFLIAPDRASLTAFVVL